MAQSWENPEKPGTPGADDRDRAKTVRDPGKIEAIGVPGEEKSKSAGKAYLMAIALVVIVLVIAIIYFFLRKNGSPAPANQSTAGVMQEWHG